MLNVLKGSGGIDVVGKMGLFATLSGVLVVGSIAATAVLGLNYGIDFAGGYEIHVKFPETVTDAQIGDALQPVVGDARVQQYGEPEDNEFLVLVREHGTLTDEAKAALRARMETLAGGQEGLTEWSLAESGESLTVGFASAVTEEALREAITAEGLTVQTVRRSDREDTPIYTVGLHSLADQIDGRLREAFSVPADFDITKRVEFVGPQVGQQLRNDGIAAVLAALFFILLYIGVRFDLFFAPGAIVALTHDVIITIGVFAVLQLEFNLPIIAAVLAIVGYSLNDTIVIYDRIRENAVRLRGRELRSMVNASINQTLSRTILTSLTTLLVVLALIIFGGGVIRDFSVALFVGITVGTYSSIAIATPVYIFLRERYGEKSGRSGGAAAAA